MDFKKDDIVFVNTTFASGDKGVLVDIMPQDKGESIFVVKIARGEIGLWESKVFHTKEEALAAHKHEFDRKVDEYYNKIKDLKDLITFPAEYPICGDNYDKPAAEAYRRRAKEITNIDVLL